MAVIVSHAAALEVLRRGARLAPERLNGAPLATSASSRRAAERRDELQALRAFLVEVGLLDVGSQLDILAGPNECGPAVARVRTHRWTTATALPIRQVFLPGTGRVDGLYVVAPELLFVELCAADKVMRKGSAPSPKSMAHVRAALLGWELCGRYGKVLPGDRRDALAARGFENRPPLTSVNDIRSFADAMAPGLAGVRRARGALALVRDGGRSPMEAAVFILLAGAACLGGFGLPAPRVNYRLKLSARNAQLLNAEYVELDNYWPRPLDVEVDGFADHGGTTS
ncbi:hypothetical protein QJ043_02090 [Olsenella sp. YH-ols2217]|uniref:Uncharacterized protein n=1 Tax=Kribbibacterium absianum TaxID=3044210 RepID=A0ABT6ZIJ2_9ACTN|nr:MULTISPECIES: hypothetical protein [unclassified Olsenella]MDJ1121382.1 hypothetical protein [Olsenella sp. YH-ols2216]MDJ1128872.1 hypothetical protein [Olsenella sp. YH-ols2217]